METKVISIFSRRAPPNSDEGFKHRGPPVSLHEQSLKAPSSDTFEDQRAYVDTRRWRELVR